ncbi:MAG: hypothetical protein ACJ72O_03405, partial [Marmoricola sp.]
MTSRRSVSVLLLALVLAVSGCGPFGGGPDPRDTAEKTAAALQEGDLSGVPFTPGSNAKADYERLVAPIKGFPSKVSVGEVRRSGDRATAVLHWVTDADGVRWPHATTLRLSRTAGKWAVHWAPSVLLDQLGQDQKIVVTRIKPVRGEILGAGGKPIVQPRAVMRFGIDKTLVPAASAAASARRLAGVVEVEPDSFVKAVRAAGAKAFVQAVSIRRQQVKQQLLDRVAAIKGARGISDH